MNTHNIFTRFIFIISIVSFAARCNAQWTQKANFPGPACYGAVGFSIGTKGYIGTGYGGSYSNDFWEWDQATNTWTQKANFGGGARGWAVGFSIGTKGYIGTGHDGSYKNDFWEWDQATNLWSQKAVFGGTARQRSTGFSIGNNGYIAIGQDANLSNQNLWEWNAITNIWMQKSDFPGGKREQATGFSIGSMIYFGTGVDMNTGSFYNDFWEWNPASDTWTQKMNFPGNVRRGAVAFSNGTKGFIGTGTDNFSATTLYNDFWEWDQVTNVWTQKTNFAGSARFGAVGFSIGTMGYIGTGRDGSAKNDFWEYNTTATSVNEIENQNYISLYPNPSTGKFTIDTKIIKGEIFVYNTLGEKVYQSVNSYLPSGGSLITNPPGAGQGAPMTSYLMTIELSDQPDGIYFLQIKTKNSIETQKLIIIR